MAYTAPTGTHTYFPPIEPPSKNAEVFGTATCKTAQLATNAAGVKRDMRLLSFWATNITASDIWLLFFDNADGATDVGANAIPSYPAISLPAGVGPVPVDGGSEGLLFRKGIYFACSSTPEKLTALVAVAIQFHADLCV